MGESFGIYTSGSDGDVIRFISSANVACGFHAGDPHVMRRIVALASAHQVRIGAHPGLPDRLGFGRRAMAVTADELRDLLLYQIGALKAFVEAAGQQLQHVKIHGALFEMAVADPALLRAMCAATREAGEKLIWLAPSGLTTTLARESGLTVAEEFYADRAYRSDKRLLSRKIPNAVIHDVGEIKQRLARLFETGSVKTHDGESIHLDYDSICVHGDTAGALDIIRLVRAMCEANGIAIKPLAEMGQP